MLSALIALVLLQVQPVPSLTVVWDPPTDPATGQADYVEYYLLKQGDKAGATTATIRISDGREYRFTPPDASRPYFFRVVACRVARVDGADVDLCSAESNEANTSAFVLPAEDACAGKYPAVFVTRPIESATGRPGSRMLLLYQLASGTPIVKVEALVDGLVVATKTATGDGDTLTDDAAIWFSTPPSGRHELALRATNKAGCARVGSLLTPFMVK